MMQGGLGSNERKKEGKERQEKEEIFQAGKEKKYEGKKEGRKSRRKRYKKK